MFFMSVTVSILLFMMSIDSKIEMDNNYENLMAEYTQKIEDFKSELNEMIEVQSSIDNYDYTQFIGQMSYEQLIRKYMPDKLKPVGFNTRSPADRAIHGIDYYNKRIIELEKIHSNIRTTKWWYNFSH